FLWMSLLPVTRWCLWEWYQHPGQSRFTRRPVDITRLPHIFASLSPAIAPVLADGDPEKLFHGGKRPERRGVLSPVAFFQQHTLIPNMPLDGVAAQRFFMGPFGKTFTSRIDIAPHTKARFLLFFFLFFL
ncbi:conjugal transfer protein TrbA, partial [Escherichia coli]|nr:conjugal transfer protein TrbA [Escherichia coli]